MPKNDVKVSVYFPKSLHDKFERLREEESLRIESDMSKNKFALKIIKKYIEQVEHSEPSLGVAETEPKYEAQKEQLISQLIAEIQEIKKRLDEIENQ